MSQADFLNYYNDTINEIVNLYGESLTIDGNALDICTSLDEEVCLDDAYTEAIIDNIIYLANNDNTVKKNEYIRKSKNAYNRLWSRRARNMKFRRRHR